MKDITVKFIEEGDVQAEEIHVQMKNSLKKGDCVFLNGQNRNRHAVYCGTIPWKPSLGHDYGKYKKAYGKPKLHLFISRYREQIISEAHAPYLMRSINGSISMESFLYFDEKEDITPKSRRYKRYDTLLKKVGL